MELRKTATKKTGMETPKLKKKNPSNIALRFLRSNEVFFLMLIRSGSHDWFTSSEKKKVRRALRSDGGEGRLFFLEAIKK